MHQGARMNRIDVTHVGYSHVNTVMNFQVDEWQRILDWLT
jgi:hypothetical protein